MSGNTRVDYSRSFAAVPALKSDYQIVPQKKSSKEVDDGDIKNPAPTTFDWSQFGGFDGGSIAKLEQTILQQLNAIISDFFKDIKSLDESSFEQPSSSRTPWTNVPHFPKVPPTTKPPEDTQLDPSDIKDGTPDSPSPPGASHDPTPTTPAKSTVPVTRTVEVHDAAGLKSALASATSGTEIKLADGVYSGNFELNNKDGVTISGSKNAVIKGGGSGYALHLNNSNNNTLTGFTISDSKKGIMLDGSCNNTLDGLTVNRIGQEGIHFRANSSNNVLKNSFIDNTGLTDPGYGEAVYIGSDPSNMQNDRSDGNQIIGNTFGAGIAAENIDIKAGTSNGVIRGNHFNVTGVSGANSADSAVDVKEGVSNYVIEDNDTTGHAKIDIETHNDSASKNSIRNNRYG